MFHNPGGAGSCVCYHPTASVPKMLQTVSRSALVPYAASEMFALVADIEKYPGFLLWCREARIRVPGEDTVEASLEIGRGPIRKTFTTRNVMTQDTRIDIGEFYTMPELAGEIRCDLHPRWNRDGTKVCFDSTHEGERQVYVIDVADIVAD